MLIVILRRIELIAANAIKCYLIAKYCTAIDEKQTSNNVAIILLNIILSSNESINYYVK